MSMLSEEEIRNNSLKLIAAAENADTTQLKNLIPLSDPFFNQSAALQMAASCGNVEAVRLLIPVSNPKANKSSSLWMAAEMGHLEIVKLLIPCCDPLALNSYALQVAVLEKRADCVEALYPHSDPLAAVAEMRTLYNPVLWQPFAQRVEHEQAAQQAERIGKSLENTPNAAHSQPTLPRKL